MNNIYDISLKLPLDFALYYSHKKFNNYDIELKPLLNGKKSDCLKEEDIYWFHTIKAPDNSPWLKVGKSDSTYILRFNTIEFIFIKSSKEVFYKAFKDCSQNEIEHIFFNQVLPLVLNSMGIEVLHASSILTSKGAVAFVGDSGFGKSTIATSLISQGCKLLSDDAVPLVLKDNQVFTSNGPRKMNLWPRAGKLLNIDLKNNELKKSYITLNENQHALGNHPLKHIYFLKPSTERNEIAFMPISGQEAIISLVKAAQRLDINDKAMLTRQIQTLSKVANLVETKNLHYPINNSDPTKISSAILSQIETHSYAA